MAHLRKEGSPMSSRDSKKVKGFLLTSGFLKYPSRRDQYLQSAQVWLAGKKMDDDVYPYWRVHDKLYDLSSFISKHPGGKFWLEITQGTDITEVFESSHFGARPESLLKNFFVKEIETPRISPFTFEENGFYKTLKKKVTPILEKVGRGPSWKMLAIQDSLFYAFILFASVGALFNSYWSAVIAGIFLTLAANSAHNFFHQKDNWRMYIFDQMLLSSKEWRISHALSHHAFPNTIYDFEISSFQPHLQLLPRPDKTFLTRHIHWVTIYFLYAIGFYIDKIKKGILVYLGDVKLNVIDLMQVLQLVIMGALNGSLLDAFCVWAVMQTTANFVFLVVGLTASHHHPEVYHEGDTPSPVRDWGIHQVAATRERGEVFVSSLFLVAISFGNHTLHHLFPTVDHSKLPFLLPAFLETCEEFGVKFRILSVWTLYKGLFDTLASITPNKNIPICFK